MNVELVPVWEIFVLYCALNANGYNKENNKAGMHPVRLKVRSFLERRNYEKYDFKWNPFQYVKQVLTTDKLRPSKETNPDFVEAIDYLNKFREEAGVDEIWSEVKKETERVLKFYEEKIGEVLDKLQTVVKIEQPPQALVLTVNLLESYFRGFSVTFPEKTYLVMGPSEKPDLRNFVHELLHAFVGQVDFNQKVDDDLYERIPEELRINYPKDKIVEESLVRALVTYLSDRLGIEAQLSNQDKQLVFPEVFLKRLEGLRPAEIDSGLLRSL